MLMVVVMDVVVMDVETIKVLVFANNLMMRYRIENSKVVRPFCRVCVAHSIMMPRRSRRKFD